MSWQRRLNAAMAKTIGLQIKRARSGRPAANGRTPPSPGQKKTPKRRSKPSRLLKQPVFILSSVRSGSTLLRVLLDSHSQFHSPHELHLRALKVQETSKYVERAMRAAGLDERELEHLLWDRILHRELQKSGKSYLVNKTPTDALMWRRVRRCWPDARFLYLFRHPLATAISWQAARPYLSMEEAISDVLKYMNAMEEARAEVPGITVRYEDLTTDPVGETKRLCRELGVAWEPGMLEYGQNDHGSYRPGLGDWGEQIKSGRVQPARPLPEEEVPEALREICVAWGYLRETSPTG